MTACESLPTVRGTPAAARAPAGPIPSARSRSVVGQRHTVEPLPAKQTHVVGGQVRGVHGGEPLVEGAGVVQHPVGVRP